MHKIFNFPIDCYLVQTPLNEPEIIKTENGIYIRDKNPILENSYNAFETIEIIPELIKTAEYIKKNGLNEENNVHPIVNFLKKWGYLKANDPGKITEVRIGEKLVKIVTRGRSRIKVKKISNKPPANFLGQKVSTFIHETLKFYDNWMLYQAAVNRDLEQLKRLITVEEDPNLPFEATHIFYFSDGGYTEGVFHEDNPLKSYQDAVMIYLTEKMDEYINNNKLYSKDIRYSPTQDEDLFKITPAMAFDELIDALYMQLFILLNENENKICPVCNKPFFPQRMDKKYCSDTCKNTAKSRRYRARFRSKHGFNYWEKNVT